MEDVKFVLPNLNQVLSVAASDDDPRSVKRNVFVRETAFYI